MTPKKILHAITKMTVILMFVVTLISCLFVSMKIAIFSSILSTLVSLLGLNLIAISTIRLQKQKWVAYIEYVFRMLLYGVAIYVAFLLKLDLVIFVIGLLSTKIAIVLYGMKGGKSG